ncbi:hypothetical protein [Brevibacillus borstelensis]|jgi:primosomal protein N''|uniref:hypothetical protein n=1 Tax=Brevibacillus borstelensis TaxID=45462 RepID=UPI0024302739|nr:hypothetical protein [Brevibacillus borstelensis]
MNSNKCDWNNRQQAILEKTFGREARNMTAANLPGAHQAVASYHDRLQENRKALEKGGRV